jgi:hypothetical protein
MPISEIEDCSASHWEEIRQIVEDVVKELGFECKLVSQETDVGVIQKRIVENLYSNELVICDVSCRNPNVMFELGMRLAFDKPVIIIKDDKTPYSFDTSPVEHITYRRDLRFKSVVDFKRELKEKVEGVSNSRNTASFLSSFGSFKTTDLQYERVGPMELVLEELATLRKEVRLMYRSRSQRAPLTFAEGRGRRNLRISSIKIAGDKIIIVAEGPETDWNVFSNALRAIVGVEDVYTFEEDDKFYGEVSLDGDVEIGTLFQQLNTSIQPQLNLD